MSFEDYLAASLNDLKPSKTHEAMEYSLMAGGKRIRPALLLAVLEDYGVDPAKGYGAAAALEMIHTYSLIHDDLPAMDNDELRRGKPTCHIAYGEDTAILAGDGLLTEAFSHLVRTDLEPQVKVECLETLAGCAGANGMIYGQDLDLKFEGQQDAALEDLLEIDTYKTAKLLIAALVMGGQIAKVSPQDLKALEQIGLLSGLQFQIVDDILDVEADEATMGKSLSDAANEKSTAVSLLGLAKAKELAQSYEQQIDDLLASLDTDPVQLRKMLAALGRRKH